MQNSKDPNVTQAPVNSDPATSLQLTDQPLIQHDGASQAGRRQPALDPAYAPIDERSVADLLAFARAYAKELQYFDPQGAPDGDWSGFLDADIDAMARYLSDPERVQADALNSGIYAHPHVVLLLTFLDLLQYARTQLNDLTRRHLEFYYHEALGLTAKPAIPDHVHALVELADSQEQFRLPAGSLLHAGQDSQRADLFYRTDQDIVANRARVASLKSLFVQKQAIGIREAHHNPDLVAGLFPKASTSWGKLPFAERAFMAMLSMALGESDPGGRLPAYPGADQTLDTKLLKDLDALIRFIQSDLAMPLPVFRILMELKLKRDTDNRWGQVNTILEQAGQQKRGDTKTVLDPARREDFDANLAAALSPNYNTLPDVENIYDLYRRRKEAADKQAIHADVLRFITTDQIGLHMTLADFDTMMGIIDDIYKDWRRIYDILRAAGRKKHPGQTLEPPKLRAYDPDKFATLTGQTLGSLTFPATATQPGSLDNCYREVQNLEAYFHIPVEDFAVIRAIDAKGTAAKPWEWQQVYAIVEKAYVEKALPKRWELLRIAHTKGFDAMILLALGDPAPGNSLPESRIFMALKPAADEQYIREQLYLEIANFTYIQSTAAANKPLDDPAWANVYKMLELAQRRKRGWDEPQAQIEIRQNIYAAADATLVQVQLGLKEEPVTLRWRTFGASPGQPDHTYVVPAAAGFAIASPLLALAEGARTIMLTLGCSADHFDKVAIDAALAATPFRFFLSAPDQLVEVIPRPAAGNTPANVTIQAIESVQGDTTSYTLNITLRLDAQAPPVEPLMTDTGIRTPWPMMQIRLADVPAANDIIYRAFQPLVLQNVGLQVEVAGITQLILQNDDGMLNAKKPFEPFGFAPVIGSSFSIAHPELCSKQLDRLNMQIDWLGAPDNLHAHYMGYKDYEDPAKSPASPIADNKVFTAQLRLYDNRAFFDIKTIQLFHAETDTPTTGATKTNAIAISKDAIISKYPNYQQNLQPVVAEEALDWSRYWQVELLEPDFQHAIYPRAAAGCASKTIPTNPKPFIVNPPYTPKIKRLSMGYSASVAIDLVGNDSATADTLYHIEPFGYCELARNDDGQYSFLPQYANEGELLIGLQNLAPPQNLALLFQMAEGSADPDVAREAVHWRYLDGNRWASLEAGRLIADSTNGLLNTGIITFDLPPVAPSTRLPADLYWIQATISKNSRSVGDMVAIEAQAVSATFADQGNAPDHLNQPLLAGSITGLAEPLPEVQAIRQPYSSFGGKGPEQASGLYTRVSERLRHKNRALTSWDYEHMVLEAFPGIYKVKCLPVGIADDPRLADQIQLIVIPDIRGKLPFDPFEPKVAADTLRAIEQYIEQHTSPAARVTISNPTYIRLLVRLGVRLRPGYNPGYYTQALDQELQRYLAPWAYDQSAEIVFGGKINANLIVNFVEERPYVDYVAGVKLFTSMDGDTNTQLVDPQFAVAPNAILVSDRKHRIDLISEEVYQESYFTGINYMQVELDFQIA
jgi:hypothetical protein